MTRPLTAMICLLSASLRPPPAPYSLPSCAGLRANRYLRQTVRVGIPTAIARRGDRHVAGDA
mgnify:FL=1